MHYPACRGKCLPVLCWMLQGLDVKPPLDTERLAGEAGIPKIIYDNLVHKQPPSRWQYYTIITS